MAKKKKRKNKRGATAKGKGNGGSHRRCGLSESLLDRLRDERFSEETINRVSGVLFLILNNTKVK